MDDLIERLSNWRWRDDWRETIDEAPAELDRLRRELADMRTMLALTYAAAHPSEGILYGDDGELQFGGFPDPIDFVRDSVSEIRSKIDARGMRRLASAMAEPKEPQP